MEYFWRFLGGRGNHDGGTGSAGKGMCVSMGMEGCRQRRTGAGRACSGTAWRCQVTRRVGVLAGDAISRLTTHVGGRGRDEGQAT